MVKSAIGSVLGIALSVLGSVATAEPISLKFAFEHSDRTRMFSDIVKPFVDAVNTEAPDLIKIDVYTSGVLGKGVPQQAQLVLDGTADIAFVITHALPHIFDNSVVELPGMFNSLREASTIYTRLAAVGSLRGFEDFYPVGVFASEPQSFHSRRTIASLDDLKGQKIRSGGPLEAAALAKLSIEPVIMPVPAVAEAISSGTLDGAAIAPILLQDLGIGRVTSSHYMLRASAETFTVLMNRKKFESLPPRAQAIIRQFSGEWMVAKLADAYEKIADDVIGQLTRDPRRKVVIPTKSDTDRAQEAFNSVITDWAAKDPRNQNLLQMVNAEVAKFRATR